MKNKPGRVAILAVLCAALPASAQPVKTINDNGRDTIAMHGSEFGTLEPLNKILGMEIKDSQDHKLGKVKDLAIDLQNGRIVEVILNGRATTRNTEQYLAIPPEQFTVDANNKFLVLDGDPAHFNNAPMFRMEDWNGNLQPANVTQVYQYYGVKPYFTGSHPTQTHAAENQINGTPALGEIQRASKLLGATAQNTQDQKLGKVENVMVDLSAGRVVEIIIASGGFLGMDQELSAVPPQTFRSDLDHDTIILDTTKETLSSAPHFKKSEWSQMNDREHVAQVYHAYNVPPYFAVDNTKQNVRDRQSDAVTPLKQGNSAADVDTTRQIRKQIMASHDLSINAQNVKIITIDGHVTLRGPVNSEAEKRQIAEIAAGVTSPANVDDQLQVKDSATPDSLK